MADKANSKSTPDMALVPALVVVDDDRDAAMALKALLEGCGYRVHAALDSAAALRLVADCQPVGVLLDLDMPGMNGIELTQALRSAHGKDLPVVAVTGWGTERDHDEALDAGVDHILIKPIDKVALEKIFPC